MVCLDLQVPWDHKARVGKQVSLALLDLGDSLVYLEEMEAKVQLVSQGRLDQGDQGDRLDHQVLLDSQDLKDQRGKRVMQDHLDLAVKLAALVSGNNNIKQNYNTVQSNNT